MNIAGLLCRREFKGKSFPGYTLIHFRLVVNAVCVSCCYLLYTLTLQGVGEGDTSNAMSSGSLAM